MKKFKIFCAALIIIIVGGLFYLETVYENGYRSEIGDVVEIKYTAYDENKAEIEKESKDFNQVTIGTDTKTPEFDDALIGMKRGDEKSVVITYPADYKTEDLRNKKIEYKIFVSDVEKCTGKLSTCGVTRKDK